jgi:hypothetical protein
MAKAVPWKSWDEWEEVYHCIYSTGFESLPRGVSIMERWSMRGRIPVSVEATLNIVSVMIIDPQFKSVQQRRFAHCSETSLRLAYGLGISRFVNLLVDLAQKGAVASSMDSLAVSLDLPGWVVQVRHNVTHGSQLPGLTLLRDCALYLLNDFILSRYWTVQLARIRKLVSSEVVHPQGANRGLGSGKRIPSLPVRCSAPPGGGTPTDSGASASLVDALPDVITVPGAWTKWLLSRRFINHGQLGQNEVALLIDLVIRNANASTLSNVIGGLAECGETAALGAILSASAEMPPDVRASLLQLCVSLECVAISPELIAARLSPDQVIAGVSSSSSVTGGSFNMQEIGALPEFRAE